MENLEDNYKHIKGWGIDADPENEPTYPMKKWTGDDHKRLDYERPPQQSQTVEVLHSNERPGLTSVFGTSTPPKGLSGQIRRKAFKYSEGQWGHWLSLILADRVDVLEGYMDDLKHGHIPNPFADRGWSAEWKHNKKGVLTTVAVSAAVAGAAVFLLTTISRKRKKKKSAVNYNI